MNKSKIRIVIYKGGLKIYGKPRVINNLYLWNIINNEDDTEVLII